MERGSTDAKERFEHNIKDTARFRRGLKKMLNKGKKNNDIMVIDPDSEEWDKIDKGDV